MPSKGQHFYNEAKDLYEKEDGQVTLTTIQGLCILFSLYATLLTTGNIPLMSYSACMNGKDRRGWLYQGQLAFVADDLIEQHDLGKESKYAPEVVNLAVWGLYNISALVVRVQSAIKLTEHNVQFDISHISQATSN